VEKRRTSDFLSFQVCYRLKLLSLAFPPITKTANIFTFTNLISKYIIVIPSHAAAFEHPVLGSVLLVPERVFLLPEVQSESYTRILALLAEYKILLYYYYSLGLGTAVVLALVLVLVSETDMVARNHEFVTLAPETVFQPVSHH
jgi:hypothetical protein